MGLDIVSRWKSTSFIVMLLGCIRAVLCVCATFTFELELVLVFVLLSEERKDGGNKDMTVMTVSFFLFVGLG